MADPDAAGWHRFKSVTNSVPSGHKLYRASAPNYKTSDRDQDLTQAAVNFLVSQGIDSIISFNEYEYTAVEKKRLTDAKPAIKYLHLKLGDFKPPTLAQFAQANTFFLSNKSTLVHCGYGWGRTGTGVTGLQIYTEKDKKTLQPLASLWPTLLANGGNNVEKRVQVSILSEQRNLFFPRVTGTPVGNPQEAFAIINFATGYYLTLSTNKGSVIALSPETVETTSTIQQAYQWVVTKDSQGYYTLSNKTASTSFALTKSTGAAANDPVTYGTQTQGNTLFTIKEVPSSTEKGRYIISPKPSPTLAVVIKEPDNNVRLPQSAQMPALLATSNDSNKFGLWILLAANFQSRLQGEAESEAEG